MKLDYDLIRELLLIVEDITDGKQHIFPDTIITRLQDDKKKYLVEYHLKYLSEVHFIQYIKGKVHGRYYVLDITPIGRSYLDNIRNDTIWSEIKSKFSVVAGDISINIMAEVAKRVITSKFFS